MTHCDTCEAEVPADALKGLCPRCLFLAALDETVGDRVPEDEPDQYPMPFGEKYVLEARIDGGGMGVVYRAREVELGRMVALKVIRSGALASLEERRRFIREARTAASLKHPNIVPVLDYGVVQGLPYFTMELIDGNNLVHHLPELQRDPIRVAQIMVAVARAVSHAHRRTILHRDLKPANILLDPQGNPMVTDFGLAMRIGEHTSTDGAGTLAYMSPEQATGPCDELDARSDVYSLGAILYELLTGVQPITAASIPEMVRRIKEEAPLPPRKRDRSIPRDLETICLRCLEKDPDRRYSSTALADDLQAFLEGRIISPGPWQVLKWLGRHPVATGIAVELSLLLVVGAMTSISVAAAQANDRREEVLRTNVYAARTLAGSVLAQLKDYREVMTQAAQSFPRELAPELLRPWTTEQENAGLAGYVQTLDERYDAPSGGLREPGGPPPFNTWFILDTNGVARSRWPPPPREFLGKNYLWRDYFQGAMALGREGKRSAFVSRAFLSEADGTQKFALSAPLYGPDGAWIGVIVAMADSGATLGRLRLSDLNDEHRTAVLVAPRDHTRELAEASAPFPPEFAVLVHDSLEPGNPTMLESAAVRQTAARAARGSDQLRMADPDAVRFDEDYRDPLEGYGGRWLGGFAPVGTTGFVVIVQTPSESALRPNQTLVRRLVPWGGAYLFLAAASLAGLLLLRRRPRKAATSARPPPAP